MEYDELCGVLRRIPILECLSNANQKLLAFTSQHLVYEDGEVLFHMNEPAEDVYLVIEGEVEQLVVNEHNEVSIGAIGKHQLFGEMAVIRKIPRLVTVRANGRVEVLRIEGEMFLQMATTTPQAALTVMQEMALKISNIVANQKDNPLQLPSIDRGPLDKS